MKKLLLITFLGVFTAHAQDVTKDSTAVKKDSVNSAEITKDLLAVHDTLTPSKIHFKQFIIPAALIGYGFIGLESDWLKTFNLDLREEVSEDIDRKFTIDDIAQYATAGSVYALNAFGVKGKHNLKDRSIILGTSYLLLSATVFPLKSITHIERPDGTAYNSFPSGHTANAFAGAEFLWQEYKDKSVWYGISGYLVASGVGAFRIINNRHWLTDVAAGAGIGILSTKAAYWLYPWVKHTLFPNDKRISSMVAPFYNGKQAGAGLVMQF
ncbi:phosphatase PAP2 family protein [Flavobacterium pallidum]|uniref:PA-phosphatase n=1 Tax=Flavobacterium pallidum TaxID=2172098 RepID=A0A2S1SFU9_9FLAO|nr:phosphatase PAP2 family protein [Flavobacterium pallidum]AWI25270.1 PA-phosphatase [Flavobacterium pallidum]